MFWVVGSDVSLIEIEGYVEYSFVWFCREVVLEYGFKIILCELRLEDWGFFLKIGEIN